MMIPPPASGDPYAAAAALDRQLRSSGSDSGDPPPGGDAPDAGPDVVVSLSHGPALPATYNASGRLSRSPTLDELGANGPDSMARATESGGPDGAADPQPGASTGASNDASMQQDAAVAA